MNQIYELEGNETYETAIRYENQPDPRSFSIQTNRLKDIIITQEVKTKKKDKTSIHHVAVGVGFVILIGLLVAIIVQMNLHMQSKISATTATTAYVSFPRSCLELRNQGIKSDGIYKIKPSGLRSEIQAFCDMSTDGGGWTLVASVHEDNIETKCGSDDFWSSYVPENQQDHAGVSNWENENVYGDINKCTTSDYKNVAYFSLNSSDVMTWHTLAGSPVLYMKENSTSRYRTNNNFMEKYGGNLKMLFDNHYPLKITSEKRTEKLLNALVNKANEMKAKISNWYEYSTLYKHDEIVSSKLYGHYGNRITFGSSYQEYYGIPYQQKVRQVSRI
ncbi:intelectin-2-like [Styela clava]